MPKAKSAEKQARAGERRRLHNRTIKRRIRSGLTQFTDLLTTNPPGAKEQGRKVISWLDRAAKSRIMHPNTSRRYKARVMSQLQAIKA